MNSKDKKDFRGRTQINTSEKYEVQYRSAKFGVPAEALKAAAKATESNNVKTIEDYLRKVELS